MAAARGVLPVAPASFWALPVMLPCLPILNRISRDAGPSAAQDRLSRTQDRVGEVDMRGTDRNDR